VIMQTSNIGRRSALGLEENVKNNVVIWLLGTLATGFVSGIAAYKTGQDIFNLEPISKTEHSELLNSNTELKTSNAELKKSIADLESHVQIFEKKDPDLYGVNIHVVTSDADFGPKGKEFISKLEDSGAAITAFRLDKNPGIDGDHVTYYEPEDKEHAILTAKILKPIGIKGVKFIWSKGVSYMDVRLGPG